MHWLLENFNAGQERHGVLAWMLGALLPALLVGGLTTLLDSIAWPLAWAFSVLVVYFCLGFRESSQHAQQVIVALADGNLDLARQTLRDWRPGHLSGVSETSLVVETLEELFHQSLLRLFGVLFWFFLLGPGGAVLYLLTRLARDRWQAEPGFGRPVNLISAWLDWLPVRAMALSFAIAGNFVDAMEAWRGQSRTWIDPNEGVLLASAAGALGMQLGGNIPLAEGELTRPVLGIGAPPEATALDMSIALIWRAALIWLAVVGLLWLGSL